MCYYTVAAHEGYNTVIAHPGSFVELSCNLVRTTRNLNIRWLVDYSGPYGINALYNGLLDGYSASAHTTSIIILNIMMNDSRNGTEYQCVSMSYNNMIEQVSDIIFLLYVTGKFQHNLCVCG